MTMPEIRLGTAYRTSIAAASESKGAAHVYAVYPLADFRNGTESTAYVLVESAPGVDTCVYPCRRDGEVLTLELLGYVPIQNHRAALRAAGYELEVVTHVRA